MPSVAAKPTATLHAEASGPASYRLAGLLVVSLFPALFWTSLLAAGGLLLGEPLSPLTLATIGAAIAAFLAAVYNAIFARL
jgi:hypothetical protein